MSQNTEQPTVYLSGPRALRAGQRATHPPRHLEPLLLALAAAFCLTSAITLAWVKTGRIGLEAIWPALIWAAALAAAWLALRRFRPAHDPLLLPITGLLTGLGLILVARLAPAFALRQLLWSLLGLGAMLMVALGLGRSPGGAAGEGLRLLRRYRYTWLFAGLGLLALTLVFGVNPAGTGSKLWIGLAGLYFQPSELLKLLMVVFLASYFAEKRPLLTGTVYQIGRLRLPPLPYLGPVLLMWGFSLLLLIWQRDLGAAWLFFAVFLAMLYATIGQMGYVLLGLMLFCGGAALGYRLFDHVRLRVDIWLNPWAEASGRAFQIVQSLLAFAAGGLLGQGIGQGAPTFIPVVHSDFVFSAIGEELGLIGALGVVALFALLVARAGRIALQARTPFRQLLAFGLAMLLGLQALTIMAGSLKLVPLTGVTLPFVSYGGSSMLTSFALVGLLYATEN
ncbi:MAG: FtsW/RodA/SpoVE family cell cycle protein [Chloroflexota bacterium]